MHEAQPRDSDRGLAASDRIVQGPESSDAGDATPDVEPSHGSRARVVFDPADIDHQEYRLLARALTNDDLDTGHRAQMALVQLVKFLRAAGVSVPDFPDTASIPDPGTSTGGGPR
jgi:hypothetical protein